MSRFAQPQHSCRSGDRVHRFAQHFLTDSALVADLVSESSVDGSDTVLEIGAGKGAITGSLASRAKKVIAIEKDPFLFGRLLERFSTCRNVELHLGDFARFRAVPGDYKVFSNIPFNRTAWIVKTLVERRPRPKDTYLVVQRESAYKYSGIPKENLFTIRYKPWFAFEVVRHLPREAFTPAPAVAVVLLRIERRRVPLLPRDQELPYHRFTKYGFSGWKPNLRTAYKDVFTAPQWKRLALDLGFRADASCTELSLDQWIGLFRFFRRGDPSRRHVTEHRPRTGSG